jgi:hypothetical protein
MVFMGIYQDSQAIKYDFIKNYFNATKSTRFARHKNSGIIVPEKNQQIPEI